MARKPRHVHVQCATSEGFRWLRRYVAMSPRVAREDTDGSFWVSREADWAHALAAAGGQEVQ